MQSKLRDKVNLLLLTRLDNSIPFYAQIETKNVAKYRIHNFIYNAIKQEALVDGDILIWDNAAFHGNSANLMELLKHYGITLIYLPAYSLKLNPA